MAQTNIADIFDPEVCRDMIREKLKSLCKLTPYIRTDNSLKGNPGSTVTIPCWSYIGMASHYSEGGQLTYEKLSKTSAQYQIGKAGKGVSISTEALQAGAGKPKETAMRQVALAIHDRFEQDGIEACYKHSIFAPATLAKLSYAYILKANGQLANENNGAKKVFFINPAQEEELLNDTKFTSADSYEPGVVMNGAIGKVAGADVKKSKRIGKIEYEVCASTATGAKAIVADASYVSGTNLKVSLVTDNVWDGTNKKIITPAVGTYVAAVANPYYLNIMIEIDPASTETEYSEDEMPALTAFYKDDITVTPEYKKDTDEWEIAAWQHYVVAKTNDAKIVVLKTLA